MTDSETGQELLTLKHKKSEKKKEKLYNSKEGILSKISVTLATTFGIMNIEVTEMRELKLPNDISVTEGVLVILNKSLSRALALPAKNGETDPLKELFDDLVKSLQLKSEIRDKYKHLFNSPFERNDDREEVIKAIVSRVQERATITYATAQGQRNIREIKERLFVQKEMKDKVGGVFRRVLDYFFWLILSGNEIEEDYIKQLEAVISELTNGEKYFIYESDKEQKRTKDERSDLSDKIKDVQGTDESNMIGYLLEKIFLSLERDLEFLKTTEDQCRDLWREMFLELHKTHNKLPEESSEWKTIKKRTFMNTADFFKVVEESVGNQFNAYGKATKDLLFSEHPKLLKKVNENLELTHGQVIKNKKADKSPFDEYPRTRKVIGHLQPDSKQVVEKKMDHFKMIHKIRELYGKQCYIGFIGPQNAGKSTLLNSLWHDRLEREAETGYDTHTERPTKYTVTKDIFAVDFPGSNSLRDDVQAGFEKFGHMNNMFIYIMEYNGEPDKTLVNNVATAYRIMSCSGKFSKIIFCLNKANWKMPDKIFDDNYKQSYVTKISDFIKNNREEYWWEKAKLPRKEKEEWAAEEEKHKKYIMDNMKSEDFLFTDWKRDMKAASNGVEGPEEVRRRIKDFLINHVKIRKLDETEDINLKVKSPAIYQNLRRSREETYI